MNLVVPTFYKKLQIFTDGGGGGFPGLTTWVLEGVGKMTMFNQDGGVGSKFPKI